jgi:hydrogenase maturation protease
MKRPLIIGYGNRLREDDGVGPRAAELVERSVAPGVARIIECHQLTPELAPEVEDAALVIFLDAALAQQPGEITFADVRKAESSAWSHHLTPPQLLSFVKNATQAYAITCGVTRTGWCEGLSAQGENLAAKLAAAALSLLPELSGLGDVRATHTTDPAPRP